jgi:hypothetical protein
MCPPGAAVGSETPDVSGWLHARVHLALLYDLIADDAVVVGGG